MSTKVFVIDDDMVSQFATRYCLQQSEQEVEVTMCDSAEHALALCTQMWTSSKNLPDVILLDLVMGEMDGWQFIEGLQTLVKGSINTRIFILSSFSNAKDRALAKSHGKVSGYFNKPLTKQNLAEVFQ